MKNNKFTTILSVLLVVLLAISLVYVLYDLVYGPNELSLIELLPRVFDFLSIILALAYCIGGYKKSASRAFKSFCFTFMLYFVCECYIAIENSMGVNALICLICAMCLALFAFVKDLKKQLSYTMSYIVGVCSWIILFNSYRVFATITTSKNIIMINLGIFILSIVLIIMVYYKYRDKDARNTL